jgi:hypothetical protein
MSAGDIIKDERSLLENPQPQGHPQSHSLHGGQAAGPQGQARSAGTAGDPVRTVPPNAPQGLPPLGQAEARRKRGGGGGGGAGAAEGEGQRGRSGAVVREVQEQGSQDCSGRGNEGYGAVPSHDRPRKPSPAAFSQLPLQIALRHAWRFQRAFLPQNNG